MANENETKVGTEDIVETPEAEVLTEDKEENTSAKDFISEFAPEPIKIPNYNNEKEMRKKEKADRKMKKRKSKKSRKRRKLLRKIVLATRNVLIFILLLSVVTATVSVLLVKMNTSEYSLKSAIRSSSPETFMVGKIASPEKLNFKTSSHRASMADVLRDNSLITVTYADIRNAVMKSTYPDFVADVAHNIIGYYVYGTEVEDITPDRITQVLLDNASYIKIVTGIELGESACSDIAAYATQSEELKGLWVENLMNQPAAAYTPVTSVAFSTTMLIGLVVALIILMILTVLVCKGYSHKMIGWAAVISGVAVAIAGFLAKPQFTPCGEIVKSVLDALTRNFNNSAVIYGAVALLLGVLVMLIGKALDDGDDYDDYEEGYIDEIEVITEE